MGILRGFVGKKIVTFLLVLFTLLILVPSLVTNMPVYAAGEQTEDQVDNSEILLPGSELKEKIGSFMFGESIVDGRYYRRFAETVVFGKKSDYPDIVENHSGVAVDRNETGSIKLYVMPNIFNPTVGFTVASVNLVLSDSEKIYADEDFSQVFSGLKILKRVVFGNLDTTHVTDTENIFEECESLRKVYLPYGSKNRNEWNWVSDYGTYEVEELSESLPQATDFLISGRKLSSIITSLNPKSIVFGKKSNYEAVVNNDTGISIDKFNIGIIKLYTVTEEDESKTVYILSGHERIYASIDFLSAFDGIESLEDIDLGNLDGKFIEEQGYMLVGCNNLQIIYIPQGSQLKKYIPNEGTNVIELIDSGATNVANA